MQKYLTRIKCATNWSTLESQFPQTMNAIRPVMNSRIVFPKLVGHGLHVFIGLTFIWIFFILLSISVNTSFSIVLLGKTPIFSERLQYLQCFAVYSLIVRALFNRNNTRNTGSHACSLDLNSVSHSMCPSVHSIALLFVFQS